MRKCYNCPFQYKTNIELADHILVNTATHKHSVEWASRYKAGLGRRMKPEPKVYKPTNGICCICHKPYEGGKANEVCQC